MGYSDAARFRIEHPELTLAGLRSSDNLPDDLLTFLQFQFTLVLILVSLGFLSALRRFVWTRAFLPLFDRLLSTFRRTPVVVQIVAV